MQLRTYQQAIRDQFVGPIPFPRFEDAPAWTTVARSAIPKRAIVLAAPKQTIVERTKVRDVGERAEVRVRETLPDDDGRRRKIVERIPRTDLPEVYREWLRALQEHRVPYLVIASSVDTYPVIAERDLPAILDGTSSTVLSEIPRS